MNPRVLNTFSLDNKVALVTGASGGLGAHFAGVLAAAGARVALAARRADRLVPLASELRSMGVDVLSLSLDVTNSASVAECLSKLNDWGSLDIVVNNAGVTVTKPLLEHSEADFDHVLDTNLKGCWLVATEAARAMVARGGEGSIVNVASILGERVAGGVAPYAISKAGVIQATKAMALELARHRIRVNALLPGYVVTDLNRDFLASEMGAKLLARVPGRRFSAPSDLDGPLLLLASDAGRAMSGAILAVDQGHLVSSL